MSFLTFWRKRPLVPQDDPGELAEASEPNRALANTQLHDEVKERGGNRYTHMTINKAASEEMLGHAPAELYDGLGVRRGKREGLPLEAKEALQVGDIAARERIKYDNAQGHSELTESARAGYRKVKGIFPWNRTHEVKPAKASENHET